jgi:hypothetical protein
MWNVVGAERTSTSPNRSGVTEVTLKRLLLLGFYPRVHEVYRRVYILLCCCCSCSCCSWEVFNQTCQYFSQQLIKHDQT